MVDFVLKILSELVTLMTSSLTLCKIGLKLNNLVIYGFILVNILCILSTKSTISQKLKIDFASVSEQKNNNLTFSCQYFKYWENKIRHISETKNCLFFLFVSEHCATFWKKNPIRPLLRARGSACC